MIITETDALPDDKALAAQELILAGLDDCHTWADLQRLVLRAVVTVDPDGARGRREQAERETARVRLWRESSGACALAGHALPTDEALSAYAHVEARAQHYRQHGVKEYIDLLRVMAYLDLLNGIPAQDRVAQWTAETAAEAASPAPTPDIGEGAPAPEAAEPAPAARHRARAATATPAAPQAGGHPGTAARQAAPPTQAMTTC